MPTKHNPKRNGSATIEVDNLYTVHSVDSLWELDCKSKLAARATPVVRNRGSVRCNCCKLYLVYHHERRYCAHSDQNYQLQNLHCFMVPPLSSPSPCLSLSPWSWLYEAKLFLSAPPIPQQSSSFSDKENFNHQFLAEKAIKFYKVLAHNERPQKISNGLSRQSSTGKSKRKIQRWIGGDVRSVQRMSNLLAEESWVQLNSKLYLWRNAHG